jgi:hypothetical protein
MRKHRFTDPKADGGDATIVRPSNWNEPHDLARTLTTDAVISADCCEIISERFEIASGIVLELQTDAILEIA